MPKPITPVGDTKIGKYFLIPIEWCLYGKNNTHGEEKLRPIMYPVLLIIAFYAISGGQWLINYADKTFNPKYKEVKVIYYDETWLPNKLHQLGFYPAPPSDHNYVFKGAPTWPEE